MAERLTILTDSTVRRVDSESQAIIIAESGKVAYEMAKAALPPLLKDINQRTVLEAIRAGAPISRAEISRRAGISKPTVSLALQALLDAGLVREADTGPGPADVRGGVLRRRARRGARPRPRPRCALPPRGDLRPARRRARAPGRRGGCGGSIGSRRGDRRPARIADGRDGARSGSARRCGDRGARSRGCRHRASAFDPLRTARGSGTPRSARGCARPARDAGQRHQPRRRRRAMARHRTRRRRLRVPLDRYRSRRRARLARRASPRSQRCGG